MKKIEDVKWEGVRVFVRCDFNVPLSKKREIEDDFRIKRSLATIRFLLENGAKVILASHLGRPKGERDENLVMDPVQDRLFKLLDVSVVRSNQCIGKKIEKWTRNMKKGEILLLENLRFRSGEKENSSRFAKRLSRLADYYVNEAFGTSHREHASITGICKFLPSTIGFNFRQEISSLDKIRLNPKRPLIGVVGGAKVEDKLEGAAELIDKVDVFLIGGKTGNALFDMKKGSPWSLSSKALSWAEKVNEKKEKVFLPVDGGGEEKAFDIGPETIEIFKKEIKKAETVFWIGPLGKTDSKKYQKGTLQVAEVIKESSFSLAGGGDTVSFFRKKNLEEKFDYLSTGGGAALYYITKGALPALEACK